MDEITEYITEIIRNPIDNGMLFPAVLLSFFILLLLIWLLSRDIRLWYWKVNKQLRTLESIDKKLDDLGEGLSGRLPPAAEQGEIEEFAAVIAIENESQKENRVRKIYNEEELDALIRE